MLSGTVTGAGNVLCVTQPAVSRLIAGLESDVGFKLFERKHNRLVPTVEGRQLYLEVERSFTGLGQIADAADSIRNMEKGRINIFATPIMTYGTLPRIIKTFKADYPDIYIELLSGPRDIVTDRIASQRYDMAIETPPINDPAIDERPLSSMDAVCVLHKDHPLAQASEIHARDLENEMFISLPLGAEFRTNTDDVFRRLDIQRNVTAETDTQQSICQLVAAGVGVAVVSPYVVKDMTSLPLVFLPFRPAIKVSYALLFPALRPISSAVGTFTRYVVEHFAREFGSTDPGAV